MYIDELKHPDRTASEIIYKAMTSFMLTPDDGMYSSVQMCADYVP
jgi:hypothetical protein